MFNPRRPLAIVSVGTSLILSLGGCVSIVNGSSRANENRILTTQLAGPSASLVVKTRNGSVDIAPEPARKDLWLEAKLVAGGDSDQEARERLAKIKIEILQSGDTVTVQPIFPEPVKSNDGASFKIRVAAVTNATIDTSNGSAIVLDVKGDVKVDTSNGAITATNVGGGVEADTSNGAITLTNVASAIDADTSNGPIQLRLAAGNAGPFTVDTSNGAVTILLPCEYAGSLDAETSNGAVTVEDHCNRVTKQEIIKSSGHLTLGPGGKPSTITSSNGRITIEVGQN